MLQSIRRGIGFGVTSGIITTLGLMVGLYASTDSKLVVLGGILSIAIADAFSDALGMHISEEASNKKTSREGIWKETISTFLFKFVFASMFIIPVLLLSLKLATEVSILAGILVIGVFSYFIAKERKASPWKAIAEHVSISFVVIVITYFVGEAVRVWFG